MDVFQVLTLCSLLGVMFVGVLGYGIYRNWQRDQLELIRAPSVDRDDSNSDDSTGRIYPNIRVSSKPRTEKPELQTGISTDARSEPRIGGLTNSDNEKGSSVDAASVATEVDTCSNSSKRVSESNDAMDQNEKSVPGRDDLSRPQATPNEIHKIENSHGKASSTEVEEVGLNLFRKDTISAEASKEKQNPKRKFLRVKASSRIERKPPQPTKRRKSKSAESLNGAKRNSARNGDARGQRSNEDFVMFFVMGEHDGSFRMNDVGHFLQARDLILDEMGLFCRKDRDSDEVLFKVGDVFYPGSFRVEELEHYRTGGISLAMKIPNVNNAQVVFEQMLSLANECAERFMGTVKDENFNSMSNQTLAHYRSRVSDFRRKQLTMFA